MTREDFGLVLSAFLEAREEIKQPANVLGCDHVLHGWLMLGIRVWEYVSKTDFDDHTRFHFGDASWMFDKRGKMIGYAFVEIASSEVWTPELKKKIEEHYKRAEMTCLSVGDGVNALEILGTNRHPLPNSDEEMLQRVVSTGKADPSKGMY